jgi:hypothetical protein
MQEHELKKKLEKETGALIKVPKEENAEFTFQPNKAKPVPDFKRLQKNFQYTLE